MGRLFLRYLDGPTYKCKHCSVDLAVPDDLLDYWGPAGEHTFTYTFYEVVNIVLGNTEYYYHSSSCHGFEIFCVQCLTLLGWKHTRCYEQSQEEADIDDIRLYYLEWVHVLRP